MPNEKTETIKHKAMQPKVSVAKLTIGESHITIKLPLSVLPLTNLQGDKTFYAITNGVIQITGTIPAVEIPMLELHEESFVPKHY
jgi:hypothetical protein